MIEGIQRTLQSVLNQHISIGKISSIIKEASERAQQFDDRVTPESTYIYLLEPVLPVVFPRHFRESGCS